MSLVIGFIESLTSFYLSGLLLMIGLILRFRYYVAYTARKLDRDASFAKIGGYFYMLLSLVVLITHFVAT